MEQIHIEDDFGDVLVLKEAPARIVSLVPSLTETLVHLGAHHRLVGVTRYCIHPEDLLRRLPRVGGTKNPSVEKILSLAPDLVVANAEENERKHIEALKKHANVFVTFPKTVESAIKTVRDLGLLTASLERATQWEDACRRILASKKMHAPQRILRTACLIWRSPWMAAGRDSYISDLLHTSGFENIFLPEDGRYPETDASTITARKPEVILLPDEPYRFTDSHREELRALLKRASFSPQILMVNGTHLAWFGWRTRTALIYVSEIRAQIDGSPD